MHTAPGDSNLVLFHLCRGQLVLKPEKFSKYVLSRAEKQLSWALIKFRQWTFLTGGRGFFETAFLRVFTHVKFGKLSMQGVKCCANKL